MHITTQITHVITFHVEDTDGATFSSPVDSVAQAASIWETAENVAPKQEWRIIGSVVRKVKAL